MAALEIIKEIFTSLDAEPVSLRKLKTAALVRVLIIFPAIFLLTFFFLLNQRGIGHDPRVQQAVFLTWIVMALVYLAANIIIYFLNAPGSRIIMFFAYIPVFIELTTNQLVLYYAGTMSSHVVLYIIAIVAIYRVFLDYRYAVFSAVTGGALFTILALLEIMGFLPVAPGLPVELNHPVYYDGSLAAFLILTVLVGISTVLFSINYGMNQALKLHRIVQEQSLSDPLTGIPNRRRFEKSLGAEWNRLKRSGEPLSVIMIDIDYFKQYNDNYGHPAGDACIKKIARTLEPLAGRPADLVARFGGEEFSVLLPGTGIAGAMVIAGKMRDMVMSLQIPHRYSKIEDVVTISLGVSCCLPAKAAGPEELVSLADEALYRAKQLGRNRAEAG